MDFFIIDRTDFDDAGDESVDDEIVLEESIFFVGTTYLENLRAGLNTRQVVLSLPYTEWMEAADDEGVFSTEYTGYFPIPNTDYYLVWVIDPGDLIEEIDEEDNRPSEDNIDQTMVVVQVSDEYDNTPNLILEEILVEVPHFELKATDPVEVNSCGEEVPVEDDQLNPHVKVTTILNASGKYWPDFPAGVPIPIPRVDLWATLKTPGIDEVPDIPIQVFNNDANDPAYGPKLKIRDLEPGTPMSAPLEMRLQIPDFVIQGLIDTIAAESADCFGTYDLDEDCFVAEMVSGAVCDGEDFIYCGGVIDNSDLQNPVPITTNLDWSCYINRIDGACLSQCEPDLDCMLDCTEDLVCLEVRVEAYDDYSEELGELIDIEPDLNIANPLTLKMQLAGLIEQLNNGEKNQRIPLLKQIEKALEADPDLAFWLIGQIEQQGMTGATDAWLVHLLERTGSPQAQEALVMVMDDPYFRTWNRIRAIVALGGVENPTEEAIASLVNITQNRDDADAEDMANAALMALGSIGKTLMESDPQQADLIRGELIATLDETRDVSETGMVLKAMENMADPALGEVISPYLQDDALFVRSAAARSLGRLKGEENLDMLTDQLAVEENRVVRASIIAGMVDNGNATQQSLNLVNDMVLKETEAGAHFHMTKYLGGNLADFPEGKRTLQILALKDPSSRIRTHARSVLRQHKGNEGE